VAGALRLRLNAFLLLIRLRTEIWIPGAAIGRSDLRTSSSELCADICRSGNAPASPDWRSVPDSPHIPGRAVAPMSQFPPPARKFPCDSGFGCFWLCY
jgi:hypothetical protein